MRRFSVRPAITLRGRTFKGLRGWAGKPLHPPLTDIPVAAYILAAAFDVVSIVCRDCHACARGVRHAGIYVLAGRIPRSLLAAGAALWDWRRGYDHRQSTRLRNKSRAWSR